MSLRTRSGNWHYRFFAAGRTWTADTGLAATERNRSGALMKEAEARKEVNNGRGDQLKVEIKPFSDVADQFIEWAKGEYREKRSTWKRLDGSMTSLRIFFKLAPIHTVTVGQLQDYMSWRRRCPECNGDGCGVCEETGQGVKEVTIRHDMHALSLLFQYAGKHNWCRANLVREVEIPSDQDATRSNVLSTVDENRYFDAIDLLIVEKTANKRTKEVRGLQDIRDLSVLMLNQGCRPEELRELPQAQVNLERGVFTIQNGKSAAARRMLPITAASRDVFARRLRTPGRWVFPSQKYADRHIGQAQRLWGTVTTRAGLAMVMYDLRHTFATRAVDRGVALPKLMAILGHSNLRSIMRYVHMRQADIIDGMEKFEHSESRVKSGSNARPETDKAEQTSANGQPAISLSIQ